MLEALAAADLDALLGLMDLLLSMFGVLAAERKFKEVLDRDRDPMKELRWWYAVRTCWRTFCGHGAFR